MAALSASTPLELAVQRATSPDFSSLELVSSPFWPLTTPSLASSSTPDPSPSGSRTSYPRVHIAVLDSSFNPPTLAHRAIASSSFPPPYGGLSQQVSERNSNREEESGGPGPYNARLLLFSARNADKKLKPGDATALQRTEMMLTQAKSMDSTSSPDSTSDPNLTAIGLINEPTFVGKSHTILTYLSTHFPSLRPTLTFLVGTDTLVRFFDPKYYPSGMSEPLQRFFEVDGSYLVSARRGGSARDREEEEEVLSRPEVKEWVEKGKVRVLGSGDEGWEDVSSTRIREAVRNGKGLEGLCIPEVEDYVKKHGLYKST